jgi:hypothetical protein
MKFPIMEIMLMTEKDFQPEQPGSSGDPGTIKRAVHHQKQDQNPSYVCPDMWTAPSSQGVSQTFDQIACVHMSGLT